MFVKSIKGFDLNAKLVVNFSNEMKPVRGKCSLVNISIYVKRIPRIWGRLQLFYKFTGGFRPYIVDIHFDGCAFVSKSSPLWENKAFMMFANLVKEIYPSIFSGCPYEGRYDSAPWLDVNKTMSSLLPPVISAGTYRFQLVFDVGSNVTLLGYRADVLVKATKEFRGTDFSFLNMG